MEYAWKIRQPSCMLIQGPTFSGKSTFLEKLLSTKEVWEKPIEKVVLCYGIETPSVQRIANMFPDVQLYNGLPPQLDNPSEMFCKEKNNLLILDDLGFVAESSPAFSTFLEVSSHHLNTTCINITHSLFSNGKERRRQSGSYHYIILFRNRRCQYHVGIFSRQAGLVDKKLLEEAYFDATKPKFSYLLVDLHPETIDECRLLTNVLLEQMDKPTIVYI